jgi:hypothetical protein
MINTRGDLSKVIPILPAAGCQLKVVLNGALEKKIVITVE